MRKYYQRQDYKPKQEALKVGIASYKEFTLNWLAKKVPCLSCSWVYIRSYTIAIVKSQY